jgi:signal transduction histidine kinase
VRGLAAAVAPRGHAPRCRGAGEIPAERLRISVADDGTGFDPAAAADSGTGHFGLDGIRERLLNHNGELAIESAPGKGTTVSIFLKLNH